MSSKHNMLFRKSFHIQSFRKLEAGRSPTTPSTPCGGVASPIIAPRDSSGKSPAMAPLDSRKSSTPGNQPVSDPRSPPGTKQLQFGGNDSKDSPPLTAVRPKGSLGGLSGSFCAHNELHDQQLSSQSLSKYAEMLETHFPRSIPDDMFIKTVTSVLNKHGFNSKTTINLVCVCRDEICRPFSDQVQKLWGNSFNVSSLGGMCFCGKTGFKAAMAHAPIVDGIERYVIWVAAHIGLTLEGEFGKVYRPGRAAPSSACGAVMLLLNELKSTKLRVTMDPIDMEQSVLKQTLMNNIPYGTVPSLVELTYKVYESALQEVKCILEAAVDLTKSEYIIVGGIQVHGPIGIGFDGSKGQDFFWPGEIVKVTADGQVDLYEEYASTAANCISCEAGSLAMGKAMANLQIRRRAIRLAAMTGDLNALRSAGIGLATVNDHHQRTLLHLAAQHGQMEVARFLVSLHPALVNAEDISGLTAMDLAVHEGNVAMADLLAANGGGLVGERLYAALVKSVQDLDVKKFKLLLQHAKDAKHAVHEARDDDGRSLAHICAGMLNLLSEDELAKLEAIRGELHAYGAVGELDLVGPEFCAHSSALIVLFGYSHD
mmetsp:Transcript_12716/g.35203  ORF Transcript_12716/g.35203 Transcript_12716/m.35203 type:complete len:598 (-) Transcript_12716:408-2201(-)